MSDPFLGEIRMVGFQFAPRGWAFCDGRILPIAQNSALFSLLGTMYGGNGQTTFALPDFRGRSPVGMGAGPGLSTITQGEQAGLERTTLNIQQMPSHTHIATGTAAISVGGTPANPVIAPTATNNVLGGSVGGSAGAAAIWSNQLTDPIPLGNEAGVTVAVQNTGGSQPVDLRNPFLGTNFIIALEGIFPARN
ncbi:phage tail protein [Cellvibrio sp. PSBB006]|uniref:phage tail protein n=1 Tax=Cellvibrio sp. PSBB006 TaxID=1987723 RepID=UPI000B3B85C1|nr:tail fiber protein [Cellvibrio sp. PSBB006]ARU27696.1 phage tail protein [Cellvibrio sp. PSBB006]